MCLTGRVCPALLCVLLLLGCFGCSRFRTVVNGASKAICREVSAMEGSSVVVCTPGFAGRARRGAVGSGGRDLFSLRRGSPAVLQGVACRDCLLTLPACKARRHRHPTTSSPASSCTPCSSHTCLFPVLEHPGGLCPACPPCRMFSSSFHAAAFFPFLCLPSQGR